MVAQAKLGKQQLKAAEDGQKLLAAQEKIAKKEQEVAMMLTEIAGMKLEVATLNGSYLTQQREVQKMATDLFTADAVVREKMVLVNTHLLGGARYFGETGNDVRVKENIKSDGEAKLKKAEQLLLEQQKAEKVAAEKAAAAKVAAENAANAALVAKEEEQKVAKLRSEAAALSGKTSVVTVPALAGKKTVPAQKPTGTRPKDLPNKGNKTWTDDKNLPAKLNLVKVVEDQTPTSLDQYK